MSNETCKTSQEVSGVRKASPRGKLVLEQVTEIRRRHLAGESQYKLAAEFGVSRSTLNAIIHMRCWK